jgi:hypothetical protein
MSNRNDREGGASAAPSRNGAEAGRDAFERAAAERNVPVDQALSQAMELWVEAQRVQAWFEVRRQGADWPTFDRILAETGRGETPLPGDELPAGYVRR